jgi:hypothetical protein
MSELIHEKDRRKALLKHMIEQLHAGDAPDEVRPQLLQLLGRVPYDEVVEVEQQFIADGMPVEEILRLCDIHKQALHGALDPGERPELRQRFNALMDVEKHYLRKEHLLFPFLEKRGITGPPPVPVALHHAQGVARSRRPGVRGRPYRADDDAPEVRPLIVLLRHPRRDHIGVPQDRFGVAPGTHKRLRTRVDSYTGRGGLAGIRHKPPTCNALVDFHESEIRVCSCIDPALVLADASNFRQLNEED